LCCYLGVGQVDAAAEPVFTEKHYGVKCIATSSQNFNWTVSTGDGTTEEATVIINTNKGSDQNTRMVFTAGTSVKAYRIQSLEATHTSNIPSGGVGSNHCIMNLLSADGGTTYANNLRVQAHWHFKQEVN